MGPGNDRKDNPTASLNQSMIPIRRLNKGMNPPGAFPAQNSGLKQAFYGDMVWRYMGIKLHDTNNNRLCFCKRRGFFSPTVTSWQKELMGDISEQPYKTKKVQNPPMLAGFLYANTHNILWGASR